MQHAFENAADHRDRPTEIPWQMPILKIPQVAIDARATRAAITQYVTNRHVRIHLKMMERESICYAFTMLNAKRSTYTQQSANVIGTHGEFKTCPHGRSDHDGGSTSAAPMMILHSSVHVPQHYEIDEHLQQHTNLGTSYMRETEFADHMHPEGTSGARPRTMHK